MVNVNGERSVNEVAISIAARPGWQTRLVLSRRARLALVLVVVIALVTVSGVRASGRSTRRDQPPFGELWIGTANTAAVLAQVDGEMSELFLGGKASVLLGGTEGEQTAMAWASQATFAADLSAGRIPDTVGVVMYDPEGWEATPLAERRDPAAAMRAFGELARSNGYVAVITPHPSLVAVAGGACVIGKGESTETAYLRCGIQADAARYADVVEVQAQYLETDVAAYRGFVAAAAQQARAANPSVSVLSGISTNFTDDPDVLYAAWRSVLDVVDGHYLNVPDGFRPAVAVAFLRMVDETRV
jgi:hypothetical protein